MSRIHWAALALASLLLASGGCLHSRVEENWANAYEAQIVWQTENPAAAATAQPPQGLDPETGMRVADRYYKTQEQQRQRQAPTVMIGQLK